MPQFGHFEPGMPLPAQLSQGGDDILPSMAYGSGGGGESDRGGRRKIEKIAASPRDSSGVFMLDLPIYFHKPRFYPLFG